ncbi:hypothetical protein MC885_010439 [Smutsia gigantea]|nr:hypothetical protein MC885_010439 [Smutsia gigantea]
MSFMSVAPRGLGCLKVWNPCALNLLYLVCVVICARKLWVNPDNIATPIVASLGELITLSILAFFSSLFYKHRVLNLVWVLIVKQNPPIMKILKFRRSLAWPLSPGPSDSAELDAISSLKKVGGNLVAIQTSQISTFLHMWSTSGVLPLCMKKFWPNPCSIFCTSVGNKFHVRPSAAFPGSPNRLIFFYIIYLA